MRAYANCTCVMQHTASLLMAQPYPAAALLNSLGDTRAFPKKIKEDLYSPRQFLAALSRATEAYSASPELRRQLPDFSRRQRQLCCEVASYIDAAKDLRWVISDRKRLEQVRSEVLRLLHVEAAITAEDLRETLRFYEDLQDKLAVVSSLREAAEINCAALLADTDGASRAATRDESWWWGWKVVAYTSVLAPLGVQWWFGSSAATTTGAKMALEAGKALSRQEETSRQTKVVFEEVHKQTQRVDRVLRDTEKTLLTRGLGCQVGTLAHCHCPPVEDFVSSTFAILDTLETTDVDFDEQRKWVTSLAGRQL